MAPRAIGTISRPTSNGSSPSQGRIQFATRVSWASSQGDRRTSSGGLRNETPVVDILDPSVRSLKVSPCSEGDVAIVLAVGCRPSFADDAGWERGGLTSEDHDPGRATQISPLARHRVPTTRARRAI